MTGLDDEQRAEIERLREAIAEEELGLAAAIDEYNATVGAAYEKFLGLAAEYSRRRDEFDRLHSEIASAMMEFAGEAGDDWQQGEEGRGYLEWMNLWIEAASAPAAFERPRALRHPIRPCPPSSPGCLASPDRREDLGGEVGGMMPARRHRGPRRPPGVISSSPAAPRASSGRCPGIAAR